MSRGLPRRARGRRDRGRGHGLARRLPDLQRAPVRRAARRPRALARLSFFWREILSAGGIEGPGGLPRRLRGIVPRTGAGEANVELVVSDLTVARGGVPVLAGVSFRLRAGEAALLRGPNGSGKTTLLRTLAGLQPPLAGEVSLPPEEVAYAAHADGLKPTLTWPRTSPSGRRSTAPATSAPRWRAMNLTDLARRPAQNLSAGQKRRLGLARLLVTGRKVWLLDEPTVSLDAASVALFADAVRAHLAGGGLALIATHIDLGLEARGDRRGGLPRGARCGARRLRRGLRVIALLRATCGLPSGPAAASASARLLPDRRHARALRRRPEAGTLSVIAGGILWVGALLACSCRSTGSSRSMGGRLARPSGHRAGAARGVVAVKALAHWITTGCR
jgi:heme exporter protein A